MSEQRYRVPFTAATQALRETLEACDELDLLWFDADTQPEEINVMFKTQEEFAYGIFAGSDADTREVKSGVLWDFWLDLEIYSNYKGRKRVAQKLEALINYLSSDEGFGLLCGKLSKKGFSVLSVSTGKLHISLPIHDNLGMWQNGSVPLVLHLEQVEIEEEVNN